MRLYTYIKCFGTFATYTPFLSLVHPQGPGEERNPPPTLEAKRPDHTCPAALASWRTSQLIKRTQHSSELGTDHREAGTSENAFWAVALVVACPFAREAVPEMTTGGTEAEPSSIRGQQRQCLGNSHWASTWLGSWGPNLPRSELFSAASSPTFLSIL